MGTCTSKLKKENKCYVKNKLQIHGRTLGVAERAIYQKIIRRNRSLKSLIDKTVYGLTNRSLTSDISTLTDSKNIHQFTNITCNIMETLSDCEHEDFTTQHFRTPSQSLIHEFKAQPFELEIRNLLLDEEEEYKEGELSACRVLCNMIK